MELNNLYSLTKELLLLRRSLLKRSLEYGVYVDYVWKDSEGEEELGQLGIDDVRRLKVWIGE